MAVLPLRIIKTDFIMNQKVNKAIYIIIGSVFFLSFIVYLFFGKEWARIPFYLSMFLIYLYTLFSTHSKKE